MNKLNYYEILQVSPNAEIEVIQAAYKRLARKYHPDVGGSQEQMVLLNEAYIVLSEPPSRQAYDAKNKNENSAMQSPDVPVKLTGEILSWFFIIATIVLGRYLGWHLFGPIVIAVIFYWSTGKRIKLPAPSLPISLALQVGILGWLAFGVTIWYSETGELIGYAFDVFILSILLLWFYFTPFNKGAYLGLTMYHLATITMHIIDWFSQSAIDPSRVASVILRIFSIVTLWAGWYEQKNGETERNI